MSLAVRALLRRLGGHTRYRAAERGFTVIELLVVLVVLPLIVGAIADAFIVSLRTVGPDTTRISDSENAQLSNAFFARDVEGASLIIAGTDSVSPYSAINPQVCGSGNGSLQVGFYRAASGSQSALSVSYRLVGAGSATELVRYSCTLNGYVIAGSSSVILASTAPSSLGGNASETISGHVSISPVQFNTAASQSAHNGYWANTSAYSQTSFPVELTSTAVPFLDVSTTYEFTMPGKITVSTATGPQLISCDGTGTDPATSSPAFTNCALPAAGATAYVGNGDGVTQSSITSVQLSVAEPGSAYVYNLIANPQVTTALAAANICPNGPCGGPTMLLLGNEGFDINGQGPNSCSLDPNNNKDKVCISGGIVIDGGTVSCGTGGVYASGGYTTAGSGTCNGQQVPYSQPIPDPYTANPRLLPTCFAPSNLPSGVNQTVTAAGNQHGNDLPGIWTQQLSGVLEPGIYVAEKGVGNVSMASYEVSGTPDPYYKVGATADKYAGVLIYLPGPSGAYLSPCITEPTSTMYGVQGSVSIAPIDRAQSSYFFGTSALDGMGIWQDITNGTPYNVGSTSSMCIGDSGAVYGTALAYTHACTSTTPDATELYGLMYGPSMVLEDHGNGSISAGRLIVGGFQAASGHGNGATTVTLSGTLNSN